MVCVFSIIKKIIRWKNQIIITFPSKFCVNPAVAITFFLSSNERGHIQSNWRWVDGVVGWVGGGGGEQGGQCGQRGKRKGVHNTLSYSNVSSPNRSFCTLKIA